MTFLCTAAATALSDLLTAQTGAARKLADRLQAASLSSHDYPAPLVRLGHARLEVLEKVQGARPAQALVYCERIRNLLKEKFQVFSGEVDVVVEVHVSSDRLEGLELRTQLYVESILDVLHDGRGEWRQGIYHTGRYEVKLDPARHGGKNFAQTAKILIPVDVHMD